MWQNFLTWLRKKLGVRSPSEERGKEYAQVAAAFQQGLEEGMKDPLFRINEDGSVTQLRELTPEEENAMTWCHAIVARAFPGYFDDEEDSNGV
jgi:hypothetical protein